MQVGGWAGGAIKKSATQVKTNEERNEEESKLSRHLASEGAEAEGVEQRAAADLAVVGGGGCLAGGGAGAARLGALVEEEHPGAVDDVGLDAGDVEDVLHLGDADDVVVGGPPYLQLHWHLQSHYCRDDEEEEKEERLKETKQATWMTLWDACRCALQ